MACNNQPLTKEDIMVYFDLDRLMITADSFGSMLPSNWEAIANALNCEIFDRIGTTPECSKEEAYDRAAAIWEDYCNGDLPGIPAAEEEDEDMKLSLDNGTNYLTIEDLEDNRDTILSRWDALVEAMDDGTREEVHSAMAPCDELEFLAEYLRKAPDDLVIG